MTLAVLLWLAAVNLAAYLAFRSDKRRAQAGEWRLPETQLLGLALAGGWPGAKLAQRRFRHKTRKQPFARLLNLVPVAWMGLAWLLTSPAAIQALPGLAAGAADLFATSGDDTPGGSDSSAPHRFFSKARHD